MKLKIGTYNIQHGVLHRVRLEKGIKEVDLAAVTAVLAEVHPAVCGINEIYGNDEGVFGNQPRALAEALDRRYTFAKAIDAPLGHYGNALLSAYPIRGVREIPLQIPSERRIEDKARYEDRVLLIAELEVAQGKTLTVMDCHFGLMPDEIELAVDTVLEETAKTKGPLVLMGDFNLTPDSEAYRRLAAALFDVTTLAPAPVLTFPSHQPDRQIDYIFCNDAVKPLSAAVLSFVASDHLPVLAEVEI